MLASQQQLAAQAKKEATFQKSREEIVKDLKRIDRTQMEEFGNPPTEMPNLEVDEAAVKQQKQSGKWRVLDRMARIVVDQQPDQPCIFSYHYEYKDFLEYYGFIDPDRARKQQEIERRKMAKQIQGNHQVDDNEEGEGVMEDGDMGGDSNVSGFGEDESMLPATGKSRFDVLLKSLIARIEFNNTLAPIQDYGRHQKKAAANIRKKQKKKAGPGGDIPSESPSEMGAKWDENYYDLDDEFIDDDELDVGADNDDEMMLYEGDTSKFQSGAPSEMPAVDGGEQASDDDESLDEDKEQQRRRYNKLLNNFRVILPDEVEEMLAEDDRKEDQKRVDKKPVEKAPQQLTLTGMLATTPNPVMKSAAGGVLYSATSPAIQPTMDRTPMTIGSVKNIKKRDRDEMQVQAVKLDDMGEVDAILQGLKQRVLLNETLNNFKREVQQLADIIDRRDPLWNTSFSQSVAQKLAGVLQKQNSQEIIYMLQRTSLLEKRKKKKTELEKIVGVAKQKIEQDLRQQNKKGDDDFVDLEKLQKVSFSVTEDVKGLLPKVLSSTQDFVMVNNDYLNVKGLEEKVKAKRQKGLEVKAPENVLDMSMESDRQVDQIVANICEQHRGFVKQRLLIAMGLQAEPQPRPPTGPVRGNLWNKIVGYYDSFQSSGHQKKQF